jgi:hypothetical protein
VPTLPTDEWTAALDRMTAALKSSLAELDRHQAEWSPLTDTPADATRPELLLAWLERRLGQWDAKLVEAANVAAAVETQLNERETALGRWHELFLRWRDLIQRGVDPTTHPEGSHQAG